MILVDGCEILHHQKDGWNPLNTGMLTTYQLVQDFESIHSIFMLNILKSIEMNLYSNYSQNLSLTLFSTQLYSISRPKQI